MVCPVVLVREHLSHTTSYSVSSFILIDREEEVVKAIESFRAFLPELLGRRSGRQRHDRVNVAMIQHLVDRGGIKFPLSDSNLRGTTSRGEVHTEQFVPFEPVLSVEAFLLRVTDLNSPARVDLLLTVLIGLDPKLPIVGAAIPLILTQFPTSVPDFSPGVSGLIALGV